MTLHHDRPCLIFHVKCHIAPYRVSSITVNFPL
jgi:hypothetical protein